MGLTTLFLATLQPLLWFAPLFLLGAFLKSPMFKGWLGEQRVRQLIRRRLDPAVYREFHNVTIRTPFGETTQIDHIYVSPFGILVIETKNMAHWIFGRSGQRQWTQQIYRTRVSFQNPLAQNAGHVNALKALLDLPAHLFKPIVVFAGDSEFKTPVPPGVCTCSNLVEFIQTFDTRLLSDAEVDSICRAIDRLRLAPSWRTHRDHVADLRRRHGESNPSRPGASSSLAQEMISIAGERLLVAAEDGIRSGARRRLASGVQLGIGLALAKALLLLAIAGLFAWGVQRVVSDAGKAMQAATVPVTRAPAPVPLPSPRTRADNRPVTEFVTPPKRPSPQDVAESKRRADEAMRVLAPNTPEVPLTLPR